MAEVYARARTYRDTGTVHIKGQEGATIEASFRTAFIRPDRIRFEHQGAGEGRSVRLVLWRDGEQARRWWDLDVPGVQDPEMSGDIEVESIGRAVPWATGLSLGTAHTIPALLLPEIPGRRITEDAGVKRIEDGEHEGASCYRLERDDEVLWIEKEIHLLRRIDVSMVIGEQTTQKTTTYVPVLNGPVPDAMLVFDPPEER